jgi:molecular chaperone HtpG
VSSGDLGIEADEEDKKAAEDSENKALFEKMKGLLGDKVKEVKPSKRLKSHPVCLSSEGEITIEMEKTLKAMPNGQDVRADKVLEINVNHDVFPALKAAADGDEEKLKLYTDLLYNQALLIEGLSVEDPVAFTNDICKIIAS